MAVRQILESMGFSDRSRILALLEVNAACMHVYVCTHAYVCMCVCLSDCACGCRCLGVCSVHATSPGRRLHVLPVCPGPQRQRAGGVPVLAQRARPPRRARAQRLAAQAGVRRPLSLAASPRPNARARRQRRPLFCSSCCTSFPVSPLLTASSRSCSRRLAAAARLCPRVAHCCHQYLVNRVVFTHERADPARRAALLLTLLGARRTRDSPKPKHAHWSMRAAGRTAGTRDQHG